MVSIRDALIAADLPGDSGRLEAELLLCHCLDKARGYLYAWPEQDLPAAALDSYRALLEARRAGRPIAYLTGRREFWSLELEVDDSTLIPRPETECLVEWALELPLPPGACVADWGTGSGAIALALASERPGWTVLASDRSDAALAVAARNRHTLDLRNVHFLRGDWGEAIATDALAMIVSNPPYVAAGDPHLACGDLRFEPDSALIAGADGLAAIRRILGQASRRLAQDGWLLLEHGRDQGAAVRELFSRAGFAAVTTRCDLAGQERVTAGRLS
jgi:release factor glutamine methyltransferase